MEKLICDFCEKHIFENLSPMCCGCHYHCECYCNLKANKIDICPKCDVQLKRNLRKGKLRKNLN